MRILIVHNHYGRFAQGGEANVMNAEAQLLAEHGHEVMKYERTNAEIYEDGTLADKIRAFSHVAWSDKRYREIKKVIQDFRPDIMHVHNYWLVLTPSIFAAAKSCGVKSVVTLHNYRMICPGVLFLRNGRTCEDCLSKNPYRILWHQCMPGKGLAKSIMSLRLYLASKKRGFFNPCIDAYIVLTSFAKEKFVKGGLPKKKLHVKPNFIADPLFGAQPTLPGKGAVFVGRISAEKGIATLLRAWKDLEYPLIIVGDGPDKTAMQDLASDNVQFVGAKPYKEALDFIKRSAFLVFPSECYEGFPLVPLEAMAHGRAVLASDIGQRRDIITGAMFRTGDHLDLKRQAQNLIDDYALCCRLGIAGRELYTKEYTPEKNYNYLNEIYNAVLKTLQ